MKIAPTDDEDLERLILAHSPRFKVILDKSRQSLKAGHVVAHDEFWQTAARRQKPKRAPSKTKKES